MDLMKKIEDGCNAWGKACLPAHAFHTLPTSGTRFEEITPIQLASFSRCANLSAAHPIVESQAFFERSDWHPQTWDQRTLYRAIWLIRVSNISSRLNVMENLFRTADLGESVDLYKCLPLCEHSDDLRIRLEEGLRSNIPTIITACMHHSPLPAKLMKDAAWNHMILKAFHMNLNIERLHGRSERQNETLACELLRYASERAYAGREQPEALWAEIPVQPSSAFIKRVQHLKQNHSNSSFIAELERRYG
jgi:hypothetical protein